MPTVRGNDTAADDQEFLHTVKPEIERTMRIRATAVMAAGLLCAASLGFAQTSPPTSAGSPNPMPISRAYQLTSDMLNIHRETQNLRDMALAEVADASRGAEVTALSGISDTADRTAEAVESLLVLAAIHQGMTSENDKVLVAGYTSVALEGAKRKLDIVVPHINQQLIYVKVPAAVADAQKLRDRLQELRQELDQYHY